MKFSEKLRWVRKANHMTQTDFAAALGISRGNLANIELGKVAPTALFINCVALMYNVEKDWLEDDDDDDLSALNGSALIPQILSRYKRLNHNYRRFLEKQILELLELQEKESQMKPEGKTDEK